MIERKDLLDMLYKHVPDKSRVPTSKKIIAVKETGRDVTVTCQDGTSYTGDILVGADGIHIFVRGAMQNNIDLRLPGLTQKNYEELTAEFSCIFGISKRIPVLEAEGKGGFHRTYAKGFSTIVTAGKNGIVYLFFFTQLDKKFLGEKEIPRYGKRDAEEAVKPFLDICVTGNITCGDVWEKRTMVSLSAIEELGRILD